METHLRMTTEGSSKDNDNQHAAGILFLPPTRIADKTASGNAGSSQSVALEFGVTAVPTAHPNSPFIRPAGPSAIFQPVSVGLCLFSCWPLLLHPKKSFTLSGP